MEEKDLKQKANDMLASLAECHEMCIVAMLHSLDEGGYFAEKDHITMLMDCAEICHEASDFYLRDSSFAGDMLDLCASVCEDCSKHCAVFFEDQIMDQCSEVCDNCAKACRAMIIYEDEEEMEEEDEEDIEEGSEEEK